MPEADAGDVHRADHRQLLERRPYGRFRELPRRRLRQLQQPAAVLIADNLAGIAADSGALERAAIRLGFGGKLRESMGIPVLPHYAARRETAERAARDRLGDAAVTAALKRGQDMSGEEAIAYVQDLAPAKVAPAQRPPVAADGKLTRRELEIAGLVADGLTAREMAAKLFISERTVEAHVNNTLNKLGLNTRIQLAGWLAARRTPA